MTPRSTADLNAPMETDAEFHISDDVIIARNPSAEFTVGAFLSLFMAMAMMSALVCALLG